MKRLLIFVCLGPAIGLLAMALPLVLAGAKLPDASEMWGGVLAFYYVGALPLAVTAMADMFWPSGSRPFIAPLRPASSTRLLSARCWCGSSAIWERMECLGSCRPRCVLGCRERRMSVQA